MGLKKSTVLALESPGTFFEVFQSQEIDVVHPSSTVASYELDQIVCPTKAASTPTSQVFSIKVRIQGALSDGTVDDGTITWTIAYGSIPPLSAPETDILGNAGAVGQVIAGVTGGAPFSGWEILANGNLALDLGSNPSEWSGRMRVMVSPFFALNGDYSLSP